MREIDDSENAEDQGEAEGEQCVLRAQADADEAGGDKALHGISATCRRPLRPASSAAACLSSTSPTPNGNDSSWLMPKKSWPIQ